MYRNWGIYNPKTYGKETLKIAHEIRLTKKLIHIESDINSSKMTLHQPNKGSFNRMDLHLVFLVHLIIKL